MRQLLPLGREKALERLREIARVGRRRLAPGHDVEEASVGERPEEGVAGQLRACAGGARDAGEEPGGLPRHAERAWVGGAYLGERLRVDDRFDRRFRVGLGEPLRSSVQAVAAVATGFTALLAEVADESAHLAAVVGDQREDVLDPVGL